MYYLLWGLKYINVIFLGLFGAPGYEPIKFSLKNVNIYDLLWVMHDQGDIYWTAESGFSDGAFSVSSSWVSGICVSSMTILERASLKDSWDIPPCS